MSTLTVTNKDRFSFSLFLAVVLHSALILGVGFSSELNVADSTSIEVALSIANDVDQAEDIDFIAATNQLGRGTKEEVSEMTTTEDADFQSNETNEVMAEASPQQQVQDASQEVLTTVAAAQDSASDQQSDVTELIEAPPVARLDRQKLVTEIANLEARIAQDQQALAKMPRTKRISSVSTRSAAEAAYLDMWRRKCERIGRANYPAGRLSGEVLMLVSILANGSLQEVRILKTSGHKALDQAALATVRQAAPFQPFNVEMRKQYDRLEFTRTWQFSKSGSGLGR